MSPLCVTHSKDMHAAVARPGLSALLHSGRIMNYNLFLSRPIVYNNHFFKKVSGIDSAVSLPEKFAMSCCS